MNIIEALKNRALFNDTFSGHSWDTWRTICRGIYGLGMSARERTVYEELTGRRYPPAHPAKQAYVVAGRRGGKTTLASAIALHKAVERDYRPYLAPGATAVIPLIAPDRSQAEIAFKTVRGMAAASDMLKHEIIRETTSSLEFSFGVEIRVATASARTIRGLTCPAAVLDELAFFNQGADATDADEEVVAALMPSLVTIPGSLLIGISSPYARHGLMWSRFERYWAQPDDDIQIYRATTRQLNSNIPQADIDAALEADPARAGAEWLGQWRQDRDTYISREVVESCIEKGVQQRQLIPGLTYYGFCDAAGGAGEDSFVIAIAHNHNGTAVLDLTVTRKPPFSAESVVQEMSLWFKKWGIVNAHCDAFSGQVVADMFRKCGINMRTDSPPKRELFRGLLPHLTSGHVSLLDNPVLANQLIALERTVSRGGTETITHPLGGHDDVAVAAAGALMLVLGKVSSAWIASVPAVVIGPQPQQTKTPGYFPGGGSPGYGIDCQEPRGDAGSGSPFCDSGIDGVFIPK
jgi:hypothetical protein